MMKECSPDAGNTSLVPQPVKCQSFQPKDVLNVNPLGPHLQKIRFSRYCYLGKRRLQPSCHVSPIGNCILSICICVRLERQEGCTFLDDGRASIGGQLR